VRELAIEIIYPYCRSSSSRRGEEDGEVVVYLEVEGHVI